jgi:hypothetical protein
MTRKDLTAIPTTALLSEVLRRVELEDGRRIMSLSVAELQRRCQDYDHARSRHPAGGVVRAVADQHPSDRIKEARR